MAGKEEVDEEKVKSLVGSILSHPSFRTTLNNIFSSDSLTATREQQQPSLGPCDLGRSSSCSSVVSSRSNGHTSTVTATQSHARSTTYTTPAQEFSAIFRTGGSSQRETGFQRGINHYRAGRGRRNAPYTVPNSQQKNSHRTQGGKDQQFRTKEVILHNLP